MKKKNVLMVHNFYQIGGGEHTVFNNEVELLKNNGHKVITYTRDNKEINNSLLKKMLLPLTTIWSFKTYFDIKKIIKNEEIDIVHCHNTFPLISPSVYYAARKMKIPVVQTIHNFRFLCPNGLFYKNNKICEKCLTNNNFKEAVKNKCYRNSKIQTIVVANMLKFHRLLGTYKKINYIFLTEFNKNKFSKLIDINSNNIFIKPNFVDSNKVFGFNNKKLENKFIFMGRLDENKGIKELINHWNNLKLDFELHIYGDGDLRGYVELACEKNKKIKFLGFKPQKDIFDDLSTSFGLIFPSIWYEGFPMTITECLALGKPVLSTNIGNQCSILKSSNGGLTYKYDDFTSFEKSLNLLIKNNKVYSKNATNYYNKCLSEDNNYEELISIYEKAKYIK